MGKQFKLFEEKHYLKRKTKRALSIKGYNHVVMKSHMPILRRHADLIKKIIHETQLRFGFLIQAMAIQPDHIHLLIQTSNRKAFANAFRFLAGQIALKILRKTKTFGIKKLWRKRIWSRIVKRGRDFQNASLYIWKNPIASRHFSLQDAAMIVGGMIILDPGNLERQAIETQQHLLTS